MKVKSLSHISFDTLVDCFFVAFDDYYVPLPKDRNSYKQRWKAAGVDYDLSYGMFDGEELIAFMIHAVDTRFGVRTAFNTGTGVLPEYRGQRLVKAIYDYALPDLKKNGIQKSSLEVIQENERAIKAYKSVGFSICKEYLCYAGKIEADPAASITINKLSPELIDWDRMPHQDSYSWDFQKETLMAGQYDYHQVMYGDTVESFFMVNMSNNRLAQFDVLTEDKTAWDRLFGAISSITPEVKIINVHHILIDKIDAIKNAGLKTSINQYEMELGL